MGSPHQCIKLRLGIQPKALATAKAAYRLPPPLRRWGMPGLAAIAPWSKVKGAMEQEAPDWEENAWARTEMVGGVGVMAEFTMNSGRKRIAINHTHL